MIGNTIITTKIHSNSDDFDIRRDFCGIQDKRLNNLRQFTSCIIDIQTYGTKDPFEKVTWIISHSNVSVRAFVVKRIQSWAQTTQMNAHMHKEDRNFRQQLLSSLSSRSIDVSSEQFESSIELSSSLSNGSLPSILNKKSKSDTSNGNQSDAGYDDVDIEEEAKWANLLSDTSDFEDDSQPLMADRILISQLRDRLVNSEKPSIENIEYIQSILGSSLSLIGNEQLKLLNNQSTWFYRLILNSRIILSDGIHKSREQAQKIAYEKMIRLMMNKQGVEPKRIANGKYKVVLRKTSSSKCIDETIMDDSIMNGTINI